MWGNVIFLIRNISQCNVFQTHWKFYTLSSILTKKKDHITDIDALRCFIVSEKSRDLRVLCESFARKFGRVNFLTNFKSGPSIKENDLFSWVN